MAHLTTPEAESILDTPIPVLDKGFVRLVDYMGSDQRIVQAARVSYGAGTKTVREDAALIDYLMRHRHTSPFEMVEFTFHIKAPIFVARQWFRHRTASINEVSARYSVMPDEFYTPAPDALRAQSSKNKQVGEGPLPPEVAQTASQTIAQAQERAYQTYQALLEQGVARELAREVLPVGLYTEFYWKQDLHNLFHFLKLRLDWHAQHEIRAYAKAIAGIVQRVVPLAYAAFEEHLLGGALLSRTELAALRNLIDPEAYRQALEAQGLKPSRVREALEKIFGETE
ncbi:FAD-dependent thymidylate synthase [Marinithermus hydrothermalis]|uniref:Flavin-dependent thymidylate synthase n=1 Tax=Marinithermus hydrothermalis (strain DSM 14884 / JCM 11576 / T1) TaxID=869210 RepID=F2NLJ0_MARHT|nr:FAD-dependent thymidylate synthase [Marinithermus hydrothermalis]AEB12089.1 Thymidylate synthase thyX [Marinithermus hydrothermalis DSM 14884]